MRSGTAAVLVSLILVLVSLILVLLSGCLPPVAPGDPPGGPRGDPPRDPPGQSEPGREPGAGTGEGGRAVSETLPYEVIGDAGLPSGLQAWVQAEGRRRTEQVRHEAGHTYVLVGAGEKPTGGYSIQVTGVRRADGRIIVQVRETAPQPGDIVIQVLTYPRAVVRFPRTDLPVIVQR